MGIEIYGQQGAHEYGNTDVHQERSAKGVPFVRQKSLEGEYNCRQAAFDSSLSGVIRRTVVPLSPSKTEG